MREVWVDRAERAEPAAFLDTASPPGEPGDAVLVAAAAARLGRWRWLAFEILVLRHNLVQRPPHAYRLAAAGGGGEGGGLVSGGGGGEGSYGGGLGGGGGGDGGGLGCGGVGGGGDDGWRWWRRQRQWRWRRW